MNLPKNVLIFALILAVFGAGCSQSSGNGSKIDNPSGDTSAEVLPDITTVTKAALAGALQPDGDETLVVNFWATWCPPCIAEMPELAAFYRKHHGEHVRFVSVSADAVSRIDDDVQPFLEAHDIPFPVHVMDGVQPDDLPTMLDSEWDGALPATFVIDSSGSVVAEWFEEVTGEDIEAVLREN